MKAKDFLRKKCLSEGDLVEVEAEGEKVRGTLLPASEKNPSIIYVKADSGYNAAVEADSKLKIKRLGKGKKVGKPAAESAEEQKGLPRITVIHTGGTIASRVNYSTGGVIASFSPEDLLAMFPELRGVANFKCRLVSEMMSEDMRFENYKKIADAVEKEIKNGAEGVIIGHGTDTLHYTSAALAFIFEKLPVPVILVGSQRSSDRGSSDAGMNLVCAARFIKETDFAGVALCMHDSSADKTCAVLPATKARKMHTSRRDAFKAINSSPIAKISHESKEISFLGKNYQRKGNSRDVVSKKNFEEKTGILRTHPNMNPEQFGFFSDKKYKGFVLEGTGIGQAPTNTPENRKNYEALKKFISKGGIVVLTSQCIFGRVHPFIYTNCRRLHEIGVIFAGDMTTETAFIKLAWLRGNYRKEEAKKLFTENLRGELDERSEFNGFDLD